MGSQIAPVQRAANRHPLVGFAAAIACPVMLVWAARGIVVGPDQAVVYTVPIALIAMLTLVLGAGPGAVSTIATTIGIGWLVVRQADPGLGLPFAGVQLDPRELVRLAGFLVASSTVVVAIELLHRVQRRLDRERARLQAVLDALPVAVWIADHEGTVIQSNSTAVGLSGLRSAPFGFERYQEFKAWWSGSGVPLEPGDWALARAVFEGATSTGERIDIERVDHSRESEERLRSVFENMSEALVLFDASGQVTYQNPAAARILDHRALDPGRLDQAVCEYPGGARVPPEQGVIPRVLRGERVQNERFFIHGYADPSDGFVGIYNGCPVRDADGELAYGFITIEDITEQARAEAALREANDKLREDDRRKDEFLAVLSHELRNPLAPIRNSVYVLELVPPGSEQAVRALEVIDRQTLHMTRLIDDLLDLSRISRGRITLQRERVDLDALVQATAEDHRQLYANNGIDLIVHAAGEPLWVDADRTRLVQVLGNLLANSAKFTPRGGWTVLSVARSGAPSEAEPGLGAEATVRVRDSGAGMSAETLASVFEPFMQATQTIERSHGGLGLGLALVKRLVEMHGGEVRAASAGESLGTELTVTLPLEQPPVGPAQATAPSSEHVPQRVLVIEDNVDAGESLRLALELRGHEVTVACSGPDGLAQARAGRPEVILCDIGLPGMDGYTLVRALRADPDPRVRSSYVVALSGYARAEDVAQAEQAGFDRHMAKPPKLADLERLLRERR